MINEPTIYNELILPRAGGRLVYVELNEDRNIFPQSLEHPATDIFKTVEFRVAPSILPGLISPESVVHLKETTKRLSDQYYKRVTLNIYTSYLPVTGVESRWLPWDLFTGLSIDGIDFQILGPVLVSMNHRVMADPHLDNDTKLSFLTCSLGTMQRDWPLIMFTTPTLKAGSFTVKSFQDNFPYCQKVFGPTTIHYFRGHKLPEEDFVKLTEDEDLMQIALAISAAWGDNFQREVSQGRFNSGAADVVQAILRRM